MQPKRKLIKKSYVAPAATSEDSKPEYQDLIEQIKSEDSKIKQDAISAIANLQQIPDDKQFEEQLYSGSVILKLINVLNTGINNGIKIVTLFAINNMCLLKQEKQKSFIELLFKSGLDKALVSLDTANTSMLKPLLVLLGTMSYDIPHQYRLLVQNVQNTLILCPETYLKQELRPLSIQYLIKTQYAVSSIEKQKIFKEEIAYLEILKNIVDTDRMFKNRALAAVLLVKCTKGVFVECLNVFINLFEEIISQLDLQKQYQLNFKPVEKTEVIQSQQQQHQQQQQPNIMTEQPNNIHSLPLNQKQEKAKQHESYVIFMDALEAIQVLLEYTIQVLQEQNNFEDQGEENDDQDMEEENQQQANNAHLIDRAAFINMVQMSIAKIRHCFTKFYNLSFLEGQNIIQLVLQLFVSLPQSLFCKVETPLKIPILFLASLAQSILINLFKNRLQNPYISPELNFIFNVKLCLQILVKYKYINAENRKVYIQMPYLQYSNSKLVMQVTPKWKQIWLQLLQIYSLFYNPEKNVVTEEQNAKIGGTLKRLIIQIPQLQLQEWRGQTIDTLFDIYSNENFDKNFMSLGFVEILNQILKVAAKLNSEKKKKHNNKSNNFINAVISDTKRFLEYKKKMIGF